MNDQLWIMCSRCARDIPYDPDDDGLCEHCRKAQQEQEHAR